MAHAQVHLSSAEQYTQESARDYCAQKGMRLMSIHELFALPRITPFAEGYSYWSASVIASGDAMLGTGTEGDGALISTLGYSFYPKERNITLSPPTKKIAAACTNSVESKPKHAYVITKEGTRDTLSGILWHFLESTDKKGKYTYEGAQEMCENLTLHGRRWRVPSVEELYGIVDETFSRPSVDMQFFGPMMHRYYWSNDTLNEKEAYAVGFKFGSVATVSQKEEAYVRCVSED